MLEPNRRRLFLDTLRPPEGYAFDRAIGTTFTLDLMTLLSVPLAFTFRDAHDGNGHLASDPLALLESARQNANRIVLFCHGGRTSVPRSGQFALAFIEQSVVPVFPSHRGEASAVFHPKLWVLRYVAPDKPARYRVVCQSRNLTFDTSWDTSLVLDGVLNEKRTLGYSINRPLADFVAALPNLAPIPISQQQYDTVEILSGELRRVQFDYPDGLSLRRFLPFGIRRSNQEFPDLTRRPILIISPFLDGGFLKSVAAHRPRSVLVSRREALLTAPSDAIAAFDEVYAFRAGLEQEPEDSEDALPPLAGLHAKIFVIDDGWYTNVAVGSANSTGAALGNPPRNVEFMVELRGKKSRFGIDALLAAGDKERTGSFRSLVEEFNVEEAGTVEEDKVASQLERALDDAADILARIPIKANVSELRGERYDLKLVVPESPSLPPDVLTAHCWPATLSEGHRQRLQDGLVFEGLSLTELSTFLAIEVSASHEGRSDRKRFARTIQLSGLPEDRLQRVLASMLRDRNRLMQLLWLLLSPVDELSYGEFSQGLIDESGGGEWGIALPGMLERMLETLGNDPKRLDSVASLLGDLRETEYGAELVGTEFEAAWEAIWVVREKMR